MDEKTEELREIFMSVADDESVTERQEESPGTLADEESVDDRLDALITRMRDHFVFRTDLDDAALRTIARGFFEETADDEMATNLNVDAETVFRARMDLHLVREADREAPIAFETFRGLVAEDPDPQALQARFEADAAVIERAVAVVEAEREMRRANYRYRDELNELLGDGDVAEQLTNDVTDDGLDDATEGLEVETSF